MLSQADIYKNLAFFVRSQHITWHTLEQDVLGKSNGYLKRTFDKEDYLPPAEDMAALADKFGITLHALLNYDFTDPKDTYYRLVSKLHAMTDDKGIEWKSSDSSPLKDIDCDRYYYCDVPVLGEVKLAKHKSGQYRLMIGPLTLYSTHSKELYHVVKNLDNLYSSVGGHNDHSSDIAPSLRDKIDTIILEGFDLLNIPDDDGSLPF